MDRVIDEMKIQNAFWTTSSNKKFYQITFPVESGGRCEKVLNALKAQQIGRKFSSIVSVTPCSIYYCGDDDDDEEGERNNRAANPEDNEKYVYIY